MLCLQSVFAHRNPGHGCKLHHGIVWSLRALVIVVDPMIATVRLRLRFLRAKGPFPPWKSMPWRLSAAQQRNQKQSAAAESPVRRSRPRGACRRASGRGPRGKPESSMRTSSPSSRIRMTQRDAVDKRECGAGCLLRFAMREVNRAFKMCRRGKHMEPRRGVGDSEPCSSTPDPGARKPDPFEDRKPKARPVVRTSTTLQISEP